MYYTDARCKVRQIWASLREDPKFQGIPCEVIDIMKDAAIAELDRMELAETLVPTEFDKDAL